MLGLATVAAKPWFLYVKLAAVAALVAGGAWVAWTIKGSFAEEEKRQAVEDAVSSIQEQLRVEQETRAIWEGIAAGTNSEILASLKSIAGTAGQLRKDFAKERASNPQFYEQPLPEGGYNAWMKARSLVVSPAASAASSR